MKFALLILFVLIGSLPGFAQGDNQKSSKRNKPDFSGKWEVDTKKSEYMKGMPVERITKSIAKKEGTAKENVSFVSLHIEHQDPQLKIIETWRTNDRVADEEIYYTDGRGETNSNSIGKAFDSKTKWDGKTLVTTVFLRSASGKKTDKIVLRTTWELSKDGKTLTKTQTPLDPAGGPQAATKILWGVMIVKMVYQRAKE